MRSTSVILTSAVMLVSCGNIPGERAEPPPPPAIGVGSYYTVPVVGAVSGSLESQSWHIDLPQGAQSTQASVERCVVNANCTRLTVPVRTGLNGLALTIPAGNDQPVADLAISVTPTGLVLTHKSGGDSREAELYLPED